MGLILRYAIGLAVIAWLVASQAQRFIGADPAGSSPSPAGANVIGPAASAAIGRPNGTVALHSDQAGHFRTDIQINGSFVEAIVDTGASVVVLSMDDARKTGITPPPSAFTIPMQTANGTVHAARIRIGELRLQSIRVRDIDAVVLPAGALRGTLLGMSFLKQLAAFEMNGRSLVLRQ